MYLDLFIVYSASFFTSLASIKPIPRVTGKLLPMFENSFLVKSFKLWNTILNKLRQIGNLSTLKKQLYSI